MSNQNLQEQYMQQAQASYQQYGYSQSQLYPYNPYSHPAWDPLQGMEGPSFTGEASVFQRRYGRGEGSNSPSRARYGDNPRHSRSRSRSRGRDDELADPAAQKRLKDTLKRLRQLEDQHYMQDQLLKDMRMHIGDSGHGRSSTRTEDSYDRYGYSSSRNSSSIPSSTYTSSRYGSSGDSGVMCFKCNKKGHFAKYCPVTSDKLCYVCNKPGHISKECPQGPSKPDADKSCYTCGKRGHIAADCTLGTEKHCYTCGKKGHIAADCMTDRCFKCEKPGHRASNCPAYSSSSSSYSSTRKRTSSSSHYESKSPKIGDQKCLRCAGYGHKIRMCPSTDSIDEKRKCHYCQGVGHLARHCISPGVITKPDETPKTTKVDTETKFMAEKVIKFAKASYPVREGSKTRAEIDEALKGMGARHRIMEKELPPAANKTDTTISNQCTILAKLKWKDMMYDRLVDNLYCYICQRSFPSTKYYQEHVTSKEHHNFQSTLQSAKAGWAVRTKLLKKLCGLPSIYVDDGNDDDDDGSDEKTSSGENTELRAIKPDLYSTDAKDTKYFVCRVCHSWGETPLQNHFDSDKHKFLYENQWKCEDCNAYFRAYSDFTQHAESMLHKQVLVQMGKATDDSEEDTSSTKKRSHESSGSDTAGAKKKRYSADKGDDTLGLQFLLPVTGFYCQLCQKFYNEARVSETGHCNTQLHQSKLQLWRVEKEVQKMKKFTPEIGGTGKGENSQETKKDKETDDQHKNGEEQTVGEGSGGIEVMQQGQENEDVDIEGGGGETATDSKQQWQTLTDIDDPNNENPQTEDSANDAQQGSEPLEAEISSDEDEDDETIRATRRGRVTRSVKTGQSPKGGKKRAKKL